METENNKVESQKRNIKTIIILIISFSILLFISSLSFIISFSINNSNDSVDTPSVAAAIVIVSVVIGTISFLALGLNLMILYIVKKVIKQSSKE
jgi:flagellar basal body-associated protein FliL